LRKTMKVIHVLNQFLPGHIAGTEMYAYNLLEQLLDKGVEAIALIPNFGKAVTEEYFAGKIRVIKYAEPSVVDRELIMSKREPEGLAFFKEILKKENPDIVHFHELAGSNGITYGHVAASRLMGFKNIMTFHLAGYSCKTGNLMYRDETLCDGVIRIARCANCYYKFKKNNPFNSLVTYPLSLALYSMKIDSTQWNNSIGTGLGFPFVIKKLQADLLQLADNCDGFVVLTHWYKNILEKNGVLKEKLHYLSQGLTLQTRTASAGTHLNKDILNIIFIGRISPFKGLHLLVEAIQHMDPRKIQLDIFGQDPGDEYAERLKKISAGMENIHWKGTLLPGDVVETIAHYDILCLPSAFSEMSPLVIQEAFAAKVPVLASDVYGNAEQVTHNKNGWLFKFKDAADLQSKLQKLVDDSVMIERAKENIKPVKDFGTVADEQIVVYEKILAHQ
jgi:glycosyltransferase involved in cell wall biosynthesis